MGKKILVVDDEPDLLRILQFRLKTAGYEVITAGDGEEALERVREESPDLILLDLMIPKMDGYRVCRLLKFDRQYETIPILVISARAQPEDVELAKECGADAYLTKPFEPQTFLEKIKELLSEAH